VDDEDDQAAEDVEGDDDDQDPEAHEEDDDEDEDEEDDDDDEEDDEDDEAEERPPDKAGKKTPSRPATTPRGRKHPTKPTEEIRRLSDLIEHPLQKVYSDGLSEKALKDLTASIEKLGLLDKIQGVPANVPGIPADTILDGHMRLLGLRRLGHEETTVLVRYDLVEADEWEVEAAFLACNANRQHRGAVLQARAALRMFEIEKKRPIAELGSDALGEARDRVGAVIGMSGRNLSRYFRLLRTPIEIQNAFRAGEVRLVVAERVADLDLRSQTRLAKRIRELDIALAKAPDPGSKKAIRDRKVKVRAIISETLPPLVAQPQGGGEAPAGRPRCGSGQGG